MSKRFPPTTLLSKYFKVIYPKYYKNSNESCIKADWAVRAALKISAILLKYPTFEGIFKNIFMVQPDKKLYIYFFVSTQKLINI